jgi:RimJ/RimL family protein N-acetyltransferase
MIAVTVRPDGLRATLSFDAGEAPLDDVVAAAGTSIDGVFDRGAQQVVWRAPVGDVASRRVAWACGFTFAGVLRGEWLADGRLTDAWTATLLATDSREPKTRWLEPVTLAAERVVCRDQLPRDGDMDGKDYKSAEVGYRTHPDARGRGVLSSALRRIVTHAFAPEDDGGLGLERISLGAGAGNVASQRVAKACGFTETGRDRRSYDLDDGTVVDLVRFDLLRSDQRTAEPGEPS